MMKMAMQVAVTIPPMTAVPMIFRGSRARARGDSQGHATQDKGKRGHQDRPQPKPGTLQGGIGNTLALLVLDVGKLHDEDGILGRQIRSA